MSMKRSKVLGSSFVILLLALGAMLDPTYARAKDTAAPVLPGQTAGDFIIKDFHFNSGEVLPELRVHYVTLGKPRRSSNGEIDNAILLLHSTGGDTTEFFEPDFSGPLYGPGKPFDLSKFYVIIPDAIGHGKSSKPSDGLRAHFPHYGYEDMIAAQHRLVTEKLGVTHFRLVMGLSMGGMHTWLWGERYPDMMDGLFPISALPVETGGRNRLWRHMIVEMIRNDPEWKNGDYQQQPHGYSRIVPLVAIMVGNPVRQFERYPTRAAADAWYDLWIQGAYQQADVNDRLYQYDASSDYNPTPDLEKIKAKLLLIAFEDDQINSPEFAALDREMPRVKNGRYIIIHAGPQSDGEGNNTDAKLWRSHLGDFLRSVTSAAPATPSKNRTEASSPKAEVDADTAELTGLATEAGHAYARRDLPTLERLTADDYVQTDVRGGVLNRTQWLEFVKNRKSDLTVETDNVQVSFYGNTAIVRGHWIYRRKVEAGEAISDSQWTSVWTRYGDGWKRHVFQNTYINAKADECASGLVSAMRGAEQPTPQAPNPLSTEEDALLPVQMRTIADTLAGEWSLTWADKDGNSIGEGEEVWRVAPGTTAFIEENRSKIKGESADDYAAMWWDSKAQKVHGIWCDRHINDQGCSGFDVTVEGTDVVLTGEWEFQRKRQAWREVFKITAASLTQTLYVGEPGKELKLASTIFGKKR